MLNRVELLISNYPIYFPIAVNLYVNLYKVEEVVIGLHMQNESEKNYS